LHIPKQPLVSEGVLRTGWRRLAFISSRAVSKILGLAIAVCNIL
jgi:hypothetical protein